MRAELKTDNCNLLCFNSDNKITTLYIEVRSSSDFWELYLYLFKLILLIYCALAFKVIELI